jgi:DNA replication and repair protein RecF
LIIQPASISLLDGPPKQRRQFVDFGAFHEDAEYLALWRRFIESLSQRNALLRERRLRELAPWTHEAARCGTILTEARKRYVERIMPVFSELGELFFPGRRFDLRFQPGWDDSHSLQSVLDAEVSGDARLGFTRCGPHKADVTIGCDGRTAKVHLSRGQTKLLVYGLQLAQARLMEQRGGTPACVLIDDIASELDDRNRDLLLEFLVAGTTQYFVTSTTLVGVESKLPPDSALIGIEQGQLTQA